MSIKISKNRLDMGSTPIKNVSYQDLDQVATQAAPATGKTRFYSKTDGALYVVPAAGAETAVSAGVPANVIAYTSNAAAPTGWTILTAAYGRVIVGFNTNIALTVGTALTTLEDRTHTHTGPSHQHTAPLRYVQGVGGYFANSGNFGSGVVVNAGSSSLGDGAGSGAGNLVEAAGTGATGATSHMNPYIQYLPIQKSA